MNPMKLAGDQIEKMFVEGRTGQRRQKYFIKNICKYVWRRARMLWGFLRQKWITIPMETCKKTCIISGRVPLKEGGASIKMQGFFIKIKKNECSDDME